MESSEGGDDQGSGWLQVKKKHRSSSKFSLHGWVGGFSGKQGSRNLRTQPLPSVKCDKDKRGGQLLKPSLDLVVREEGNVASATLVLNEDDKNVHSHDKCVVTLDNECPKSPLSTAVNVEAFNHKPGADQEHTNNSGVQFKIKWGNLDDEIWNAHQENSVGADRNVGQIEDHQLIHRKAKNGGDSLPCVSATGSKDNKLIAGVVTEVHAPLESQSLPTMEEFVEENCKEVNEVFPDVKTQIINENKDIGDARMASFQGQCEFTKTDNDGNCNFSGEIIPPAEFEESAIKADDDNNCVISGEKIICTANEEASMTQTPVVVHESSCSKVSGPPLSDGESSKVVLSQDPVLLPIDNNGASEGMDSGEVFKVQRDTISDDLSKSHIVDAIDVDGTGGSKERFRQRLWCFLFENLNRALDELYLLCELECDLEQVREAILVLDEAGSDFRELNSRVEEFEKVKKSSSNLPGEAALTMKSDHRRPHALSWEVRRMTTSPHRAEILSSSLEAFRKIQQERARLRANDTELLGSNGHNHHCRDKGSLEVHTRRTEATNNVKESLEKPKKQSRVSDSTHGKLSKEKKTTDLGKCGSNISRFPSKESSAAFHTGKSKKEPPGASSDPEKLLPQKDKMVTEGMNGNNPKSVDHLKRQTPSSEREKERRNGNLWKSMDAWKEKRNWEDILASSYGASSRFAHSPGISRRSAERARILHDKLMSPDKRKKSALDLKKEAEEKHARAMRIRNELETERVQKLQRASEKLNRVNEWQAVRNIKMREVIYDRHRRSESRHEAFLAQVVRRAGDESSKVNEVRFITSLNGENKKLMLRQKLHDSELRRAEKLQMLKTKQKEDMAREEAVLERKRLIEAEKLQRLAETQRKKEEAQLRREEERRASTAAREAKAIEQMRRKKVRAKAQQEEAELLAQKLAERLRESEQRRKYYLEQIRERASIRDQSSPLVRRSVNKDGLGKSTPNSNFEDFQANNNLFSGSNTTPTTNGELEHILKRRIKKIRQRLMALKYEFVEPSVGSENAGIGYRTAVATARAKIGRWLQELQKLRQARKEGAANFGLIAAEMIKFLDGRDAELQSCRQAGLLDFIASALPASHTSKPEACQVTIYLLRLLRVVLSLPENRGYFLAQNLIPPTIPMLVAAIENYIKIVASVNAPSSTNLTPSRSSTETLDTISEILDGFLWTVAAVIGHESSDERQLKMQDGLVELVVAYRVIHRLRDLFALYDRPQVEGSPFPPSILLSINLLAVLTSKFRNVSSTDWESFTCERMPSVGNEIKDAESVNIRCSSSCIYSGDNGTISPTPNNGNLPLPLPDVPEERPLDESPLAKKDEDAISHCKIPDEAESISTEVKLSGLPYESPSILVNDSKCSVSLKKNSVDKDTEQKSGLKQPLIFLLSSIAETGLVCLPSMLTAVLLQANNRLSSEQTSYVLPSNFEEVATGVLKVLNNLAQIDMTFIQKMLARSDLKMEFFHVMGFILSYCTSKWGAATDQNGLLLLESLSLLGYFALFHPENQAVLRWGKNRTILHKVCDLPFAFFSDPELMPVLAGTLVAACFGCEQNKGVIQQELSMDMLLSLLRSCRNSLPVVASISASDNLGANESGESNQVDNPHRSHRCNLRSTRVQSQKSGALANNRTVKMRNQRENKMLKLSEEMGLKQNQSASQTFSALTLYSRFPGSFIHKAEQFFSAEVPQF